MQTWVRILLGLMVAATAAPAWADGGSLVARQTHGDIEITAFAAPRPLVAGPVDLSVLVQEVKTGRVIEAAHVSLTLTPHDPSQPTVTALASFEAAQNKLLQACTVELAAGEYDVCVACLAPVGSVELTTTLEVGSPPTGWKAWWPWFSWPVVPVVAYVACQLGDERRKAEDCRRNEFARARMNGPGIAAGTAIRLQS